MGLHEHVDEELLRQLAAHQGSPMITIIVPTHRWGPTAVQDRVFLVDTIERVARSPELALWPDGAAALERLRDECTTIDLQHALDGVVVYASATASGHMTVDVPVAPRVALGGRIALGAVTHHVQRRHRAWVLAVTDEGARVWAKDGLDLSEVHEGGFPFTLDPDDRRRGRWEFGRQRATLEQTHRGQMVREINHRVTALMEHRSWPVFVAGNPKLVARVAQEIRLDGQLSRHRLGMIQHRSSADLVAVARHLDQYLDAEEQQRRATAVTKALGATRLATDLDEITELVHDGNSASLLLDEALLRCTDEPRATRLDHVIATMLARRDEVAVVRPEALGSHGPHALVTRY